MRRALLAFTLAGTFAASQAGFLDPLWALLTSVWSEASHDEGCILDPDGHCNPTPQADEGCGLDPYGQCSPAPQPDAGCILDPDGRCSPQGS